MEFFDIPKSRYIQLNEILVRKCGYRVPSRVYFEVDTPIGYCFKLVGVGKEKDSVFGSTKITPSCRIKIPLGLEKYVRYCVAYDSKCIHIYLA